MQQYILRVFYLLEIQTHLHKYAYLSQLLLRRQNFEQLLIVHNISHKLNALV